MKLNIKYYNKIIFFLNETVLHSAVRKANFKIIKILMSNKSIKTNIKDEIYFEDKSSLSLFLMILYIIYEKYQLIMLQMKK